MANPLSSQIYILAVGNSQESAANLLNSCFPGIQTTDSQEFSLQEGSFKVLAYTKFPGTETTRRQPEHVDLLLCSVPTGDKFESDILNYATNKRDARDRFLVNNGERKVQFENITVIETNSVAEKLKAYAGELTQFNEATDCTDENYLNSRRKFTSQLENVVNRYDKMLKFDDKSYKLVNKIEKCLDDFANFDLSKGLSTNEGKIEFSPEGKESNGIGVSLNILQGDEFDKGNPTLPLVVRDNLLTLSIELKARSADQADGLIESLETVKTFVQGMGLLEEFEKNGGASITFSKEDSTVWADLTLGGIIGERIVNKIRSFNLEKFKTSLTDSLRIQTDLNVKDIWDEPNLDNIINKISVLTVLGQGKLLNIRSILHLIREGAKYTSSDSKKKNFNLISYGLLILSTFEQFGVELKYDPTDLKANALEAADAFLGGEGMSSGMIDNGNETFKNGILPMAFGTIDNIKPMLESFGPGIKNVDLDKISFEVVVPFIRTEVKLSLLLPGLTEFLDAKVFN